MTTTTDPSKPSSKSGPARKASSPTGSLTAVKVVVTVAILAGVVMFFRHSARGHTSGYKMVDELMLSYDDYVGKRMQVHGWVEAGSIDERIVDQAAVRTFVLENKGKRIAVRNKGPKPDSFRDKSEVVAEGMLVIENGAPVLEADNLLAKCPSKYEGAARDKLFE